MHILTHVYISCLYKYEKLVYIGRIMYTYSNYIERNIAMRKQTSNKNESVRNYITSRIEQHIYNEGQVIESESRLCKILNVSRMTVRKALDELVSEGVVYKEKGRGTFVSKKPKYAEFRFGAGGFTQEAKKRGMTPFTKDATLELIEADKQVAQNMNIPLHEKVWKVTRIRCTDDTPIIYVEEYYLYSQCPDLTIDIVSQSIYEHLEKKGISFSFLDQKLEAVSCTSDIAKKLGIKKGHPLIKMSLIIYMKNGTVFNCGTEYYRTDKYTLIQSVYSGDV